jgi:23S rRNA pseudouridine1911/1915/1917 synthase
MRPDQNTPPELLRLRVPAGTTAVRLDRYLADNAPGNLTRSRIQKLIDAGLVLVDGAIVPRKHRLTGGEDIQLTVPAPEPATVEPETIALDIVYEDEHLAVINKPAGMVTHPAAGNRSATLANALVHHFRHMSQLAGSDRPGIVHRLDKNTSGLLVVARTDSAYQHLQHALQRREVKRTYTAIVCGHMKEDEGRIEAPIGRSRRNRKKMVVTHHNSREAITDFTVTERFRTYDVLEVRIQTGRTHQIRVHFAHLGHPVLGDPEYSGRDKWHRGAFAPERNLARQLLGILERQALHALRLQFEHPLSHEQLAFEAPIPDDMAQVLNLLRTEGC